MLIQKGEYLAKSVMKKNTTPISALFLIPAFILALSSCTEDYFPLPPKPVQPKATPTLEAKFVTTPPVSITSSYWNKADYRKVSVTDLSTGNLYGDGLLNMTGTYNGKSSFSNGADPDITMKAAYDNDNLYLLIEWTDNKINPSNSSWLLNGPEDPLKSDTSGGWTSQRNNDQLALAFEIASASSAAGNFSSVGCAASCHNNEMKPQTGTVDIWNWDVAHSEAMGYANDMVADGTNGFTFDSGTPIAVRNNIGSTDRSGPAYEWDGVVQNITKPLGPVAILDPAFYILNKTPFTGDPALGDLVYHDNSKGCFQCHGVNGEGGGSFGDGPAFTRPEVNRFSRQTFNDFAISSTHTGFTYYAQLNATERENIIAFIRGYAGVPGYYLQEPDGSNADIETVSNVPLAKIDTYVNHTTYKVLFKRALNTGNADDITFEPLAKPNYVFGLALMDNDGKNHIGSLKEIITFLAK